MEENVNFEDQLLSNEVSNRTGMEGLPVMDFGVYGLGLNF